MLDPAQYPSAIALAFEAVGGIGAASKICDRSCQALSKWRRSGFLPRTEYTGETCYSRKLALAASERGYPFDAVWLLNASAPHKLIG